MRYTRSDNSSLKCCLTLTCCFAFCLQFFVGHGWFNGTVTKYRNEGRGYYWVVYDDGDEEEYNNEELSEIIDGEELSADHKRATKRHRLKKLAK